ncbi:trehalose 6-phosphate synthase [Austwickia chelonae]|uniref:Alpha,alpha-trehalose-phosphate synthase n=1 Tax=Austwickia chelonae NBRC 105200 TaxID=1184607 RepID=K6VM68_9MICO|nr:trehalose-6-phosphate synthase [Austwickia chelonae]GAB77844.1 alpha,alpha-trehalose-phosphate synthase [Austwickia chelonae NBRC 105200]SEV90682.1 trehalose 6-phosphate synthase [Austwickia chelonae]
MQEHTGKSSGKVTRTYDFVVAANRLPVDRHDEPDGSSSWQRSPGGLVTAMDSVMRGREGAWVGWAGDAGDAPDPFEDGGMYLVPVALTAEDVADYYEGLSNDTLWPIYHDVIVPATFHRRWWQAYRRVNGRFAQALAEVAAPGATVWIHDYQLQLVPALLRQIRPDVRIGWFNHIPFPPVELFAQLPWRAEIIAGLIGADFLGFQKPSDAGNFIRACRQLGGLPTKRDTVTATDADGSTRHVRAAGIPISIDTEQLDRLARSPEVIARAQEIRESLGNPRVLMLGVDRLDYTKGLRHRLKAYQELLKDEKIAPPDVCFMQVAVPSRERVDAYRDLRDQVELTVGQINGDYSGIGATAVHYLHQSFDQAEMAAMYQAADVMLVTPLRDGMNLVAKEYVACHHDGNGALVLSEFAGAADELNHAFLCNPHDIQGLKNTIIRAATATDREKRRRMRSLRKRVAQHDVQRWAGRFLDALECAPHRPPSEQRRTPSAKFAGA